MVNHLHQKALRIVYNKGVSLFEDLLKRCQSVSTYLRSIHLLGIELYRCRKNNFSHTMNGYFEKRNIIYNLQSQIDFITGQINNALKSLIYLEPKIWNIIPTDIRNSGNTGELSVGLLKIVLAS